MLSNPSQSAQIDRLCDEFEHAWKANEPVSIEDQLAKIGPQGVSSLFRELLEVEVELRSSKNEIFSIQEYLDRFPSQSETIDLVFRKVVRRKKIGDYTLLDEVGNGGMGVVYRARQIFLNKIVAIKILPPRYITDSQVVSRFRREMQMIGGLNHPNIVQALNAGEFQGTLYLVMEFVDGINTQQLTRIYSKSIFESFVSNPNGFSPTYRFPIGAAAEIIRQAAHGLEHANECGLVHRDIKPANLMITRTGVVKILDLGLGKFRSAPMGIDTNTPLTKFGATMGTMDYMPPEQWENATDVDIRGDIYSLGCTLYFLLTGHAPFDGPEYSSAKKKLVAHVDGNIPSLHSTRPDCQDEFVQVLEKMLAKDPKNRYQTPAELLTDIAPFAQADELQEMLKMIPIKDQSDIASTPALSLSSEDTQVGRKPYTYSTAMHGFPFAASQQQTEKNSRALITGLLCLGSVILLFGLSYILTSSKPDVNGSTIGSSFENDNVKQNQPGQKDEPKIALSTRDHESPVAPVVHVDPDESDAQFNRVVEDLTELPGLGGQWWFVETPWYLPFVRESIAETLKPGKANIQQYLRQTFPQNDPDAKVFTSLPYLNPNTVNAQSFLWNMVDSMLDSMPEHRKKLVCELQKIQDSRMENEQVIPILQRIITEFRSKTTDSSASDHYTVALFQHRLSQMQNDPGLAKQALDSYKKAIELFTADAENPGAKQMLILCRIDELRLEYWSNRDFDAYKKKAESLKSEPMSGLLKTEFLASYGDICMYAGKNNDLLFEEAQTVLKQAGLGEFQHPLEAYIHERFAWSLIDQCKFKDAELQFREGQRVRENNRDQNRNPFAEIFIYHDMHGVALTKRYLGDLEGAKDAFQNVITGVEQSLSKTEFKDPAQLRYFTSLRERLVNTLERYGDCALYSGAASYRSGVSWILRSDLIQSAESYEKAIAQNDELTVGIVLRLKLAIIKAVLNQTEEAAKLFAESQPPKDKTLGTDKSRIEYLREIAGAAISLKEGIRDGHREKIGTAFMELRNFLTQFGPDQSDGLRYRRETLELQMFAVELLISTELNDGNIGEAREDLRYLDSLLQPFAGMPSTRPFSYRFYDLAIRSWKETPEDLQDESRITRSIRNQLQYIRQSRAWQQRKLDESEATISGEKTPEPSGTIVYYFNSTEGIAIYSPSDSKGTPRRFVIPYTRQQVKEEGGAGQKLQLPSGLVKFLEEEKAAGRIINVSINDEICWFRQSEAIRNDNWPFD